MTLVTLISLASFIIADSSDSSAAAAAPLVLLLSGFIFYAYVYARYRNANKRHSHERETSATVANLTGTNSLMQSKKGLSNATMKGANHTRVRGSLAQESEGTQLLKKFMP